LNDDNDCSFAPSEHDYYNDQSTTMSKLQKYKTEATVNKYSFKFKLFKEYNLGL